MAYTTLVNDIQSAVYTNGNNEITGAALQAALLEMVGDLGAGAQYMGEATPSTSTAGLGDKRAFWIAKTAGTYTNMGGVVLTSGFGFILYNGSTWSIIAVPQTPAAGSIGTTELADGSVTTAKLANGAVTNSKLAGNSVGTANLQDEAVTDINIAANAVGTTNIKDNAVTNDKIAAGAVDASSIASLSVGAGHIITGAVTTPKIADGAVTTAKLAADAGNMSITAASGTTLTAAVGNYYRYASSVTSLTITLPTITSATAVTGFVVSLTTGGSIDFHLTPAGGETIKMYNGLSIVANKSYELNFLWNGSEWIVAFGEVVAWT